MGGKTKTAAIWVVLILLFLVAFNLMSQEDEVAWEEFSLECPHTAATTNANGARNKPGMELQQIPEEREGLEGATSRVAVRMTLNLFGRSTDLDLSGSAWRPYDAPRVRFGSG